MCLGGLREGGGKDFWYEWIFLFSDGYNNYEVYMKKEEEIIAFLDEKVFNPVLDSATASNNLKSGIRLTRGRMLQRDALGIVHYFWSAIVGTERSIGFAAKMKKEGFTRFEEVLEEFRVKFNNDWLAKP